MHDERYFDDWHARVASGAADVDTLWTAALDLPEGVLSNSLLTGAGLDEVADILALTPGMVLLDLACGRGGIGLELARRSGARLIGVDFARSAIAVARARAEADDFAAAATYTVADMRDTRIPEASVDAVVCVDALQFADPPRTVADEMVRVLREGGRLVVTAWQAADPHDPLAPDRLRRLDVAECLRSAGCVEVETTDRDDWLEAERRAWERVVALTPTGDPHLDSLQEEGRSVLSRPWQVRRVLVTALRPEK